MSDSSYNKWLINIETYIRACKNNTNTQEEFIQKVKERINVSDVKVFLNIYWNRK